MAPLPKSFIAGYTLVSLNWQLSQLETAFNASVDALVERRDTAEATVRRKWGIGPDEEPPDPEYFGDEVGYAPEFWEEVSGLAEEMNSSIVQVRSAFLIVLFHTFEKLLKRWTGTTANYRRQTAERFFRERQITVDLDEIDLLKDAVDLAKHGNKRQADRVRAVAPELVSESGELRLAEDAHLVRFFDIFRLMRYVGNDA